MSFPQAALGSQIMIPTLEGEEEKLNIPAGTQTGSIFRIKGRGIYRGTEKGDQLVIIRIVLPKDLTDEDRKLFEKLAAEHPIQAREDLRW